MNKNRNLRLESCTVEPQPVNLFLKHIPNSKLYYFTIEPNSGDLFLKDLQQGLLEKFPEDLHGSINDWIDYQKECGAIDDSLVFKNDPEKVTLNFSLDYLPE